MKPILLLVVLAAAGLLEVAAIKDPLWRPVGDGKCYERNRKDRTRVASCDTIMNATQEMDDLSNKVVDLETLVAQQQDKIDNVAATLENEEQEKACPSNFVPRHQESCYYISDSEKTVADAKAECESMGAKLAEVETAEENDFLRQLMSDNNVSYARLGGSEQAEEGRFVWVSDNRPITFTNWIDDDDNDDMRDCIYMKKGGWFLGACWSRVGVICELIDMSE